MPRRIFNLTDGSIIVPLISGGRGGGIIPGFDGLGGYTLEGQHLQNFSPTSWSVPESYKLNVVGKNTSDLAMRLQALVKMLRKAAQYFSTNWQTTPVYLEARGEFEAATRYALVRGTTEMSLPNIFQSAVEYFNWLRDFGLNIIREHPWRGSKPGVLPSTPLTMSKVSVDASYPATGTMWHLANFSDDIGVSRIYNNDVSLGTFSANLSGTTAWRPFFVLAAVAAGDIVYLGNTIGPWHHFVVPMSVAMAATGYTAVVEYWNGTTAAWTALVAGTEYTVFPTGDASSLFFSTGDAALNVAPPQAWTGTTINAVLAWWIRVRITAVTAIVNLGTTSATQQNWQPNVTSDAAIQIEAAQTEGDMQPLILGRLRAPAGATTSPCMGTISRVLLGAKTRNLDKFWAHLSPAAAANPADWTAVPIAFGTDTALASDMHAPRGRNATCTFATDTTSQPRVTWTGDNLLDSYVGEYRVFAWLEQVGGANGDIQVKLRTCINSIADSDPKIDNAPVRLVSHDAGWELVDLGFLTLPFVELAAADFSDIDIIFRLMCERLSGTGTLKICQIMLLPIDEWSMSVDDPIRNTTLGSSALRGDSVLDIDPGIVKYRAVKYVRQASGALPVADAWDLDGHPVYLPPATKVRFYFILARYATQWGVPPLVADLGMHAAIELYGVNRYSTLRI